MSGHTTRTGYKASAYNHVLLLSSSTLNPPSSSPVALLLPPRYRNYVRTLKLFMTPAPEFQRGDRVEFERACICSYVAYLRGPDTIEAKSKGTILDSAYDRKSKVRTFQIALHRSALVDPRSLLYSSTVYNAGTNQGWFYVAHVRVPVGPDDNCVSLGEVYGIPESVLRPERPTGLAAISAHVKRIFCPAPNRPRASTS
ncbi:hypothetical protein NMY22_g18203 [Coprinellus aureogranulatus]|nr:hypothetical protein NMY22_g18203 [Coprinellus aureogranulatus]